MALFQTLDPSSPLPNPDQSVPFHCAIWLAAAFPALKKRPPATRTVPVSKSGTTGTAGKLILANIIAAGTAQFTQNVMKGVSP